MKIIFGERNKYYFFICFIINIILTKQEYDLYGMEIKIGQDNLEIMNINNDNKTEENDCQNWIPSLLNPILLVHSEISTSSANNLGIDFNIIVPAFSTDEIKVHLYYSKIFDKYNAYLARAKFNPLVNQCYFGLSSGLSNYTKLNQSQNNLIHFWNNNETSEKIFSFDNWTISKNTIKTALYFGDANPIFDSTNGNTGTCKINKEDAYWGCTFKKMSYKGNIVTLNKTIEQEYYKIYFSSENYQIIFPNSFKETFLNLTHPDCKESSDQKEIYCINMENENYGNIQLSDDIMNITIEIDNMNRFNKENVDNKNKTRIVFEDIDYFILPLIMFKRFYMKFDLKNEEIKFYTTDDSILKIKKEIPDEKNSSNVGTVFLVIFIIILILGLTFGIVLFLKKRNSVEKNINKYNKFEDEENFVDMNTKRVF